MAAKKPQNTAKTGTKRKVPSTAWKKGQSGNPGGRPKNEQSISYWMTEFGQMTPEALAGLCETYAKDLRKVKGDIPMFAHIAIRALMGQINEPSPGVLALVLDRTEGKVSQPVELSDLRDKPDDALFAEFQAIFDAAKARAAAGEG